jgi:VWFA-related protein
MLGPFHRGGLVAQDTRSPRLPTFRVSTELIQIDVVVTDSSGKPVGTLVAEDFDIKQDGRSRPVRFAEYVEPNSSRTTAAPSSVIRGSQRDGGAGMAASRERSLKESVKGSQERFTGRRIVVVVDDSFMNFDSVVRSKEALTGFVAESLRAGDVLSIVGANDPAVEPLVFTAEPEELGRQIGRVRWDAIKRQQLSDRDFRQSACPEPQLGNDLQGPLFTFGTYAIMASVLEQMRELPGRKALMLLADGIQTCPGDRDRTWERLRRLTDYASRSAVVIYGVQTLPFSSGVKMPEQRATEADIRGSAIHPRPFVNSLSEYMRSLSERTGGFARRTNDIRKQLDRVLADFGGYYLLAYEPPPDTFQPGKPKFRKVAVRVRNGKLRVRARSGFYSVDDERVFAR